MSNPSKKIESLIFDSQNISESDVEYLLSAKSSADDNFLFEYVKQLTGKYFRKKNLLKAKVCISNYCNQNCNYCFCNSNNTNIERYRFDVEAIINISKKISSHGIKSIILKSGVDNFFNTDMISHIIYVIKTETDINVTLALCERKKEEYISWAIAGADNYLFIYGLNDKYINLDNIKNEEDIIKFSEFQKKKIKVSVELIVGVPNQQTKEIAKILLMLKNTNIESLIITPYTAFSNSSENMNLIIGSTRRVVAAARLIMHDKNIFSYAEIADNNFYPKASFGNNGTILDFSPSSKNHKKLMNNKKKERLIYS